MSQVLANPEGSDPLKKTDLPKTNFPFCKKIADMIDTNKCHSDPRFDNNHLYLAFLYIILKVQDKHYLFLKSISFILFAILFYIFFRK